MDIVGYGQLPKILRPAGTFAESNVPDLTGRIAIITGTTSGVGKVSAEVLAKNGAYVIMACRNVKKAKETAEQLRKERGVDPARLDVMELDLSSLKSVRAFAEAFTKRNLHCHILINNAGIMAVPKFTLSPDNVEMQTATNHLGHWYLTTLLFPVLRRTAADLKAKGDPFGVRIVNLSSMAHLFPFPMIKNFEDINNPKRYFSYFAYSHSKRCNVLFTRELQKRLDTEAFSDIDSHGVLDNFFCNSVHPGAVATDLYNSAHFVSSIKSFLFAAGMMNERDGALTQIYCATHPNISQGDGKRVAAAKGQYFVPIGQLTRPLPAMEDATLAADLWTWSAAKVKEAGLPLAL
ncbi:hypothetical protein HDU96_011130 [Phlyctochytrium bullatum]|nr:hypothetical protein HDU96_011130 [Phlyctochytrium bullatum]